MWCGDLLTRGRERTVESQRKRPSVTWPFAEQHDFAEAELHGIRVAVDDLEDGADGWLEIGSRRGGEVAHPRSIA
jgi:hypothetical protein